MSSECGETALVEERHTFIVLRSAALGPTGGLRDDPQLQRENPQQARQALPVVPERGVLSPRSQLALCDFQELGRCCWAPAGLARGFGRDPLMCLPRRVRKLPEGLLDPPLHNR